MGHGDGHPRGRPVPCAPLGDMFHIWNGADTMGLTSERARELGKLSAEARRQHPTNWPRLDSIEHMKTRLEIVSNQGMAGRLTASEVGAQERVCRAWLEGFLAEQGIRRMRALEAHIRDLEAALAEARTMRRVS